MTHYHVIAQFRLGVVNAIDVVTVNFAWFFVLLLAPLFVAFQHSKQSRLATSCKDAEQAEEKVLDKMYQGNAPNIQATNASESDDKIAQSPVDAIIDSFASSVGAEPQAVLAFDALHPELEILAFSDQWVSKLGTPNGNLSCLLKRGKVMSLLQQMLRSMTADAASGRWTPETAQRMFCKKKRTFPNGSKQTVVLSLVVPDPATRCNENENAHVVFLLAEWLDEACQRPRILRRTTRGSQTASPKTPTCGNLLASIAEDEEQEPFQSTVY